MDEKIGILSTAKGSGQQVNTHIQTFISKFAAPFRQPYKFDKLVYDALSELCEFINADRAVILECQPDGSLLCTYETIMDHETPKVLGRLLKQEYEIMKPILDKADKDGFFYEKSTVQIFQKYPDISFSEESACYIPLSIAGNRLGYLVLFTIFEQVGWTEDLFRLASMAASILAGAFSMRRNEKLLEETRKRAQQAHVAKNMFLSNMSHEIRTPMNAILGMAQIAGKTSDAEKLKKCIETIELSSNQLLSIINDVLDISKIESGKLELTETVFSLERAVIQACTLVKAKANDKGIKMHIDADTDLRLCYRGDDVRISQILVNLLSNAIKFTPEGGSIWLTIGERGTVGENKVQIRMAVEDNGIGITQEQIQRIFNSFEQADGSISREYGGIGLGLAITKRLAEKMGGSVVVESGDGSGSKFTVSLILKLADREDTEVSNYIRTQFSSLNILIISDSCKATSKLAALIRRFDLHYDRSSSMAEAVLLAQAALDDGRPYEVVFFDFNMHGVESLKNYPILETIVGNNAVVLVSEYGMWSSRNKEIHQYGIKRTFEMPLFASLLYDTLMSIVYNKRTTGVNLFSEAEVDFSNAAVLLAEDVEINRTIFISLLEDTGIQIDCAKNGRIAVEMFKHSPDKYDIVVMDVQMPKMNGLEATKAIRALGFPHAQTVPIIAMTANAFKEDADECIAAGMNDHMAKPIGFDSLQAMLKKWLPKAKQPLARSKH